MFLLFELCAGDVLAIELLGPHNAAANTIITLHALHHSSERSLSVCLFVCLF
jgi:hypothetical protein